MIIFSASLQRCCCFKDIKKACLAAAIYTLILYTVFALVCSFHINQVVDDIILLIITIILCCLSILMIITSILLIIGLCSENSTLLLIWVFSLLATTLYEILLIIYLIIIRNINPLLLAFYIIDFIICVFNLYCSYCVCCLYFRYKRVCTTCSCYHCKCSQQLESGNFNISNPPTSHKSTTDIRSINNESSYDNLAPFTDCALSTDVAILSSSTTCKKNSVKFK